MTNEKESHSLILIVNGREKPFTSKVISYSQVVEIAYPEPNFLTYDYDVTFFRGKSAQEGDLLDTDPPVHTHNKMVFNVRRSDKS